MFLSEKLGFPLVRPFHQVSVDNLCLSIPRKLSVSLCLSLPSRFRRVSCVSPSPENLVFPFVRPFHHVSIRVLFLSVPKENLVFPSVSTLICLCPGFLEAFSLGEV